MEPRDHTNFLLFLISFAVFYTVLFVVAFRTEYKRTKANLEKQSEVQ